VAGTLKSQMQDDLKSAIKSGHTVARDTIRFTLASVKNAEIEKGGELDHVEELALLQRESKRRLDSIEQFRNAGRTDLVDREEAQFAVLERYLPEQLSPAELSKLAQNVIDEVGAQRVKDLGKVMPMLIERAAGRADGKQLSAAARALLQVHS
jgi:uncharacterized protein